eukprot:7941653-Pyramimonas_sp.AAC.1
MSAVVGTAASAAPRGAPRAPGPYAPGVAAAGSLGAAPVRPAAPSPWLGGAGAWPSTVSSRGKMGPPRASRAAARRSLSPSGS